MSSVDRLRRWEQFGGSWRVVTRDGDAIVIALCRCDGGEEVERLSADDDELVAFVGDRSAGP